MTEADGGAPGPAAPAPKPAAKRARKRASGTRKPRAAKAEPAPEAVKTEAPKPTAKPPAETPARLNDLIMEQTAESLSALSSNLTAAMTRANQVFSTAFMDQSKNTETWQPDPLGMQSALNDVWGHLASQPETLREAHATLWQRYADIWERHAGYMLTGQTPDEGPIRDKRFRDPEWRSNPAFSMLRESYLATSQFITDLVERTEGVDEATKRKAVFFIKQAVDAASPSNFLMTNPAALRAMFQSGGTSLMKGVENLAEDLKRGKGALAISQTDLDAYKVGENVATSPGKVVFRNRVFELIQYAPSTEKVHEVPLLIFPPWINKFYILDLQPKNSMIKWLTDQGHTVFLVSWVNPGEDMAEVGFEDYMREGIYAAVEAVTKAANVDRMNTVGYCVGGTLLAATLAHMAKLGDERIQSATFFASQADFKLAGDLLVFSDEAGIKFLEDKMDQAGGVLDAQTMADTFNSLRSNDLIWNYVVDNYYIGKQPPPFDLLYWNADQTRMPKALHLFYLRQFYRDNALSEGKLSLLGEKLSLKDVKIPIFMQSSKEDHIAPAPSVYRSALSFGGPVEFIVAGSGHIAGVINHPSANKYQYWTNKNLKGSVDDWMAFAHEAPGSWWPYWDKWLGERSGEDVPARTPGDGELKPLADAPGEYVKVRSSSS
ncbi:PHA/PHB synthase family protein [Terricaulis silvestris]|uniref:Poly-beta-hydroxybutyrate polymerase n=1 Tax=Terricaulis silvestris TaxID=2686094 RepID=A0A6I6MPI9_9CAUL|nr:class I poly(R)-hydroxyalkanoic acid synthase [Terricaulis silvestris]QGZ95266.1 Poly-beta-hydroxybutyrate polymerase [Terricaulis silvestris]